MGHRANYVLIEHGRAAIFHDAWGAMQSPYRIAQGPKAVRSLVTEASVETELLAPAFAEGGVLLDVDERVLLVFGRPDLFGDRKYDGFDSRKFLARAAASPRWRGWTLRWDEDAGLTAFSAYLKRRKLPPETKAAPESSPLAAADAEEKLIDLFRTSGFISMAAIEGGMAERPHGWRPAKTRKMVQSLLDAGELLRRGDGLLAVNNALNRATLGSRER